MNGVAGHNPHPAEADERPWTREDTRAALRGALEIFRAGGKLADAGLSGMIQCLNALIVAVGDCLPDDEVELLDPATELLTALHDLEGGVTHPAFKKADRRANHRHSRHAIDLKARCIVMVEQLMDRGSSKEAACGAAMAKITRLAPLCGLEDFGYLRPAQARKVIERWQADARRQRARPMPEDTGRGLCRGLLFRIRQLRDEIDECLLEAGVEAGAISDNELLDGIMSLYPPIAEDRLSHLSNSGDYPSDDEIQSMSCDVLMEYHVKGRLPHKLQAAIDAILLKCATRDWRAMGEVPERCVLVPEVTAR